VAVGKQALDLTKETFKEFFKDNATWKAAATAYSPGGCRRMRAPSPANRRAGSGV